MKPRKVIITIETETGYTIKELRQDWNKRFVAPLIGVGVFVDQIQVNVVKPTKARP